MKKQKEEVKDIMKSGEVSFESIVNSSYDIIMYLDLDTGIKYINKALPGFEMKEVMGTLFFNYLSSKSKAGLNDCLQGLIRGEIDGKCDIEYFNKIGDVMVFEARITPYLQSEKIIGFIINAHELNIDDLNVLNLNKDEGFLKQISENIDEVLWIVSSDGKEMIYVSPAYEKIWGKSCSSLYETPRGWIDAIHPNDKARVEKAFEEKIIINEFNEEYRIVRPDKTIRWIKDKGFSLYDKKGKVLRITGIAIDITKYKLVEEDLREASIFIDSMGASLLVLSKDLKVLKLNKAAQILLGYAPEEVPNLTFYDLFPENEYERHHEEMRLAIEKENTRSFETFFVTKDSRKIPVVLSGRALKDEKGEMSGFIGVLKNISKLKKNEEDLKVFENAINQSAEIIFITDYEGVIENVNPTFEKVTGYKSVEAIGLTPRLLNSGKHDTIFYQRLWRDIKAGNVWKSKITNKKKSGELFTVDSLISPILNDNKEITHFVSIQRDISLELKLNEKVIQSEKLSSLGTFISGVAHELNNPITSIIGYSELLMDEENLSEDTYENIEIVMEEAKRTAKIVKNLVNFSRTAPNLYGSISLNDVINRSIKFCHNILTTNNIKVKLKCNEELPSIVGDPYQLQQVFVNIIINANDSIIDSKEDGFISISISKFDNDNVRIIFENSGSIIDEEKLIQVFDPFFTTKEVGKGTGLGLFVSYGIIRDHDGIITVENINSVSEGSDIDKGVRFIIDLPIKREQVVEENIKIETDEIQFLGGLKMLVVDDESNICEWFTKFAAKHDCETKTLMNGQEAKDVLETERFDIIFSDIKMAKVSGYDLALWYKSVYPDEMGRFVLMTGLIDNTIKDFCKQISCKLIIKPFTTDEILKILDKIEKIEG